MYFWYGYRYIITILINLDKYFKFYVCCSYIQYWLIMHVSSDQRREYDVEIQKRSQGKEISTNKVGKEKLGW